eukprot:PhF_6_TR5132/c0_g1_i4/m.7294
MRRFARLSTRHHPRGHGRGGSGGRTALLLGASMIGMVGVWTAVDDKYDNQFSGRAVKWWDDNTGKDNRQVWYQTCTSFITGALAMLPLNRQQSETKQITDNRPDPAENAPEKPAAEKTTTEKPAEKATEKPAEKPTEKPTEKATEKPAEKATDKPAEKAPEKPAEKPTEKPADEKVTTEKPEPLTAAAKAAKLKPTIPPYQYRQTPKPKPPTDSE